MRRFLVVARDLRGLIQTQFYLFEPNELASIEALVVEIEAIKFNEHGFPMGEGEA